MTKSWRFAAAQKRVRVTIDTDFGELIFVKRRPHTGLIRIPDVRVPVRLELLRQALDRHASELEKGALVTVRGQRIRVSMPLSESEMD